MYIPRTLEKAIREAVDFFPVVLVCGPRGVGKTTLLKACGNDTRSYVSLDVLENRRLAREDPALFLQRFRPPIFIDEIQHAPQLFPYIKALVDEEKAPGMFWLASSHEFRKMRNVTASLAGRMAILHLAGLSLAERERQPERTLFLPLPEIIKVRAETAAAPDTASLFRRIWRGSCPGMHGEGDDMWQSFYASHVQTYMERDIRALRVGNELVFFAFLKALAARTGQTLNCSHCARGGCHVPYGESLDFHAGDNGSGFSASSLQQGFGQAPHQEPEGVFHGHRPCLLSCWLECATAS